MMHQRMYVTIHFVHAALVLLLLITGAMLYFPDTRTALGAFRAEFRILHVVLGFIYFCVVIVSLPWAIRYERSRKRWRKTFHLCLQIFLALGWGASGWILWVNAASYFGVRQTALLAHDALSWFAVPWIAGHMLIYYVKRSKRGTAPYQAAPVIRGGDLMTRREVLVWFTGGFFALCAGGLWKWVQPLSSGFLAGLDKFKPRGYFRIYSVTSEDPAFDPSRWTLTIDGLVETPALITFQELLEMPSVSYTADFHCVTGWSVYDVNWKGVSLPTLLERLNIHPEGKYVKMYSADRIYTETYELQQLLDSKVLIAFELDGEPLSQAQGAPVRLFHPKMYGYKSIKWLHRIEFTDRRDLGYWEEKENYALNGYIL
jgi:hypothetical protein